MASPYVGLRHYETDEADIFFGRTKETRDLTSHLLTSRLVIVYGPSGVGKTSLIMAGVLAGLGEDTAHVLPVGRPPHTSAFRITTPPDDNPFSFALLSSWSPETPPGDIRGLTISQFLQAVPVRRNRFDEVLPLVAVIDQFEEVFNDVPLWAPHREAFLDQLGQAVEDVDRLRLVLSMKEDAVGEILPYESRLSDSYRARYRVRPLAPEAALEAVTGPLRSTFRQFAPGVAEVLVDDLRTTTLTNAVGEQRKIHADAVEPIGLQVVCSDLWEGLPDDVTTITAEHRQDHGNVEDSLTRFCSRAVTQVAARENIPAPVVWEWLERNFVTDLGTRGAAYEGVAATGGMPNAVARAFEEHRVLRSATRSGSVWFELLHDGLIEPIRRGRRLAEYIEAGVGAGPDTTPDTYMRMAETALAEGMLPQAEDYALRVAQASQDDPRTQAEAKSFLGKLLVDQARTQAGEGAVVLYETAERHYQDAAALFESEQNSRAVGRVLASLGRLFMVRGQYADAVGALRSALDRIPGDFDSRIELARALSGSGQPQAALAEYGALLSFAPGAVEALVGRGIIEAHHGDPRAALTDLDNATRLRPEVDEREDVISARARLVERLEQQT